MHRIFVDSLDDVIRITGDDFNHMKRSLRFKVKDLFEVSNQDRAFLYELSSIADDCLWAKKLHELEARESDLFITLYMGVAKGEKMDMIIQKAVELGVSRIVPVNMERSIAKLKKGDTKKLERYRKIARMAASQSRRLRLAEITDVIGLKEISCENLLVFYENEDEIKLKERLKTLEGRDISILIGPEGGLDKKEIDYLLTCGSIILSLGPRILRCETAPLAVLSIIQYELGDIGNAV